MDIGLIFPNRGLGDQDVGGARKRLEAGGAAGVPPTEPVGGAARQIQWPITLRGETKDIVHRRLMPSSREKPRRRAQNAPVPKPTHVGEASSLRCSGKPPLRNSAKWFRNFGRRNASAGQAPRGPKLAEAAENRPWRLFTKNTGLCEAAEATYTV